METHEAIQTRHLLRCLADQLLHMSIGLEHWCEPFSRSLQLLALTQELPPSPSLCQHVMSGSHGLQEGPVDGRTGRGRHLTQREKQRGVCADTSLCGNQGDIIFHLLREMSPSL
jgi:hypothetical protein